MNDQELLNEYASTGSEAAFTTLVGRHTGWVQASAQRQMRGDPGAAQDVTQAVFILLAKKAGRLRNRSDLITWLFGAVRYCAMSGRRSEQRRKVHERKAAAMSAELIDNTTDALSLSELLPNLDELIARLGVTDRQAILLRYFEKKSLAEVGASMGISEEAAKKRVARAVDRLRNFFMRDGVVLSVDGLASAMLMHANPTVTATPGHVALVVEKAIHGATDSVAATIADGAANLMARTLIRACALGAMILGISAGVVAVRMSSAAPAAVRENVAALPAASQPATLADAVPDQSTPASLIRRVDYASAHGKKAMLMGCVVTRNQRDAKFIDAMADVIVTFTQVHIAAVQQFGKEGEALALPAPAAPRLVDESRWTIQGDRATGFDSHMGPKQTVAVRQNGIWKLDLAASDGSSPESREQHTKYFHTLAVVNRKVIERILSGEIASAAEAQQELEQNNEQAQLQSKTRMHP